MQRANKEYANRVAGVLDDAIASLKAVSDEGVELAEQLEPLRSQVFDTLSLTLQQSEAFRSDKVRFDCERSTKHDDLVKLEAKLSDMREERQERRDELETELDELKRAFEEKRKSLKEEQGLREQSESTALNEQRSAFEVEMGVVKGKREEASDQYEAQRRSYDDAESRLQATIVSLKNEMQTLTNEHELAFAAKQAEIESVRVQLEQQTMRRNELEDHFARVDLDNAEKEREAEHLRRVLEIEEKALALLDRGAIALQKIWRGMHERALVAKMKAKKKKGKKKGGSKKSKKKG